MENKLFEYILVGVGGCALYALINFASSLLAKLNKLVDDMRIHIDRDDQRMALLNEAIIKLAVEAAKVSESAEVTKNLVQSASGDKSGDLMGDYHKAVSVFKQQGYPDTEAHKMAAGSILGGDDGF